MCCNVFNIAAFFSAGESLARADYTPQTSTAMKENVERVLQFMTTKRIRMHHTSAKGENQRVKLFKIQF